MRLYDVTELLREESVLSLVVGNGWYAGYLNGEGEHHLYGKKTAVLAMYAGWIYGILYPEPVA